jgi:hypothetical protein
MEVDQFLAQTYFYDYYQAGIFNKILFKTGLSDIIKKINHLFLERVSFFKPDIIWVFKGMELMPSSLEKVRKLGIKLVNYNPDNPFLFTGQGSGNQFVTDSIGLYDFHFSYNLEIEKELRKKFDVETAFLPFGFEISNELFDTCSSETEVVKACFLGNPDAARAAVIEELAREGAEIDVYGNNWSDFVKHKNIHAHKAIYGKQLWEVLRKYRVQLNLMRIHNEDSHNMRSFEVPGIGGIMLAPDTTEHRMFFKDQSEVYLFDTVEHCSDLVSEILSLTDDQAAQIRQNARARSVRSGYSYKDRSLFVFNVLKKLHG